MKRLSKLLALVLTGVMALTLLADCSGGVALSEKEFWKISRISIKSRVIPSSSRMTPLTMRKKPQMQ